MTKKFRQLGATMGLLLLMVLLLISVYTYGAVPEFQPQYAGGGADP